MFVSFSKTLAKLGGVRLGLGLRIKKSNVVWILIVYLFVLMFQAMWYLMLLCGWMVYAVCYGLYWCIKKAARAIRQHDNREDSHA